MITSILAGFLGVLVFLFFFWRRLREDYPANQIFSTALFMLCGILLGTLLARKFFPLWWFWASGVGAAVGFTLGLWRFKFRFHESLEAAAVSFLPWISILFLKDAVVSASIVSLSGFLITLFLLGAFFVLDIHYKKLTWYRSGRVGFAGIATAAIFFLIRAGVSAFYPYVLSFSGRLDAIISSVVAFAFFLVIYNLSKRES